MSKLTYKSYSWDKEFEIKGYFSEDKSKVVDHEANSGILTYSPNEIILEIFGEFSSDDEIITDFGDPIDKIYGFDSHGKLLILESYGSPFGTENIPGFPIRKYRIKNFKIFDIDYVTTSPSRSARCETNKPPAMRVRIEGYTKKLQTRYNKGVQANCKAKGEKYGTKGT